MSSRLAVIGFDAQLDGLDNVDRVAAAFYKGAVHDKETKLTQAYSYSQLYQLSAQRIMQSSQLSEQQLAVVIVAEQPAEFVGEHNFIGCQRVATLAEALTLSAELIDDLQVAVLIMAAHLKEQPLAQAQATISYDQQFCGYGQSSGVASVLLADQEFAAHKKSYIYAYLNSFAVTDDLSQIAQCIARSFAESSLSSEAISSVEVSAPANRELQTVEQNALLNSYKNGLTLHTSLSCIKSVIGESGSLSALCGFLNVVFALQQRYRPAVKDWSAPHQGQLSAWLASPFYLFNDCAPAFPDKHNRARYCSYSCLSADRYAHLILQENQDNQLRSNGFNAHSDLSLFILTGNSPAELLTQLRLLDGALDSSEFKTLAQDCYQSYQDNAAAAFCVVLLAEAPAQLKKEIALAVTGIAAALANQKDWKTPRGSYFCVNRQAEPKICFLYPGIGATYLGLGRDLLQLFPELYSSLLALTDDSSESLKDKLLNPRSVVRLDAEALKQCDLALRSKLADIAECGVGYACLFTRIFRNLLNIDADFAAGYSMGEVSMFAALDCWQNPRQMSTRLANSPLFTEQLSGELKTLRSLWQLPASAQGGETLLWESYNIKGTVSEVKRAIRDSERVYITLINTPDSLVIAGYPADCLAVAERLAVRPLALNVHNAIHSEPAYQHYQQMIELYSMALAQRIPSKLYSSSCYLPVPFKQKAIAVSIAKCLCEPVDFPRLINTLLAEQASLFIEMGAGRSLCAWTEKILAANDRGSKCMTVAVNGKGNDQQLMIFRALAKLLSAGVKVELKRFFHASLLVPVKDKTEELH